MSAYRRAGKPCPRCGPPRVREAFMNRGSHLCPRCQRRRRRSCSMPGRMSRPGA
ncbi:zinc finger domain-containing protein [Rhodococcus sp. NPDC059234]|uniref:zinc finger domain-containing protein n=1 Tax=Rhodococcus sp. NPDC059234 TaxID=3346781 RepID=UPI003671E080